MPMTVARLNAPADGPVAFADNLKAVHVVLTFSGNYATGGYSLIDIATMYGINLVEYGICHTISWCDAVTATPATNDLVYGEVDPTTNKLKLRHMQDNAVAGDPEVGNGLAVDDVYLQMTLLGT